MSTLPARRSDTRPGVPSLQVFAPKEDGLQPTSRSLSHRASLLVWLSGWLVRSARRANRLALVLVALTPFGLSLWHAAPPTGRPKTERPLRSLVFEQYLVNLGPVPVRPEHYARFAFFNASDRVVKVKKLEPSCGCLSPRLDKKVYEPGEWGFFFLRVRTANEAPGPKRYTCRVLYEDPEPHEVEVTFKLVLPEQSVTVRPRSLIVYTFSDQPVSKELVVTDVRPRPLRVVDARCTLPFVSVRVQPVKRSADGGQVQKVVVRTESVPVGQHRGVVVLTTDDPDFPRIVVPLWVERPERPTVLGAPETDVSGQAAPSGSPSQAAAPGSTSRPARSGSPPGTAKAKSPPAAATTNSPFPLSASAASRSAARRNAPRQRSTQ